MGYCPHVLGIMPITNGTAKTSIMSGKANQKSISSVDTLDDIVFEHRNRDYGVYFLNKKYKQHLLSGLAIAFFLFGGAVVYPFIEAYRLKAAITNYVEKRVTITVDRIEEKPKDVVPLPPPPPEPIEKLVRYTVPIIVDTALQEPSLVPMDEQVTSVTNDLPPSDLISAQTPAKREIIEEDDPGVVVVEENAVFQGGDINTFRIWVQQNIIYPQIALEIGLTGKVIVQFAVNSKGQVVDVRVLRGVHPELDKEVVRCILSSPRWLPAKQGGKPVKQLFVIPIVFTIQ